uniref:Uncharacterized protein n=1 Tax=Amphora coffeiformis TaxID=265554 RepID=A0A7S3L447_9STRA|mmetsp:Transcript_9751/g.18650  ORF Transcript_9751/g.18650 Transcript_9751/m.18650 type:complete len:425 (+) Transcript_9751:115-1389(+)|eukprot:scaffold34593_cov179-Amphora_coffeaeformis.AAC.11
MRLAFQVAFGGWLATLTLWGPRNFVGVHGFTARPINDLRRTSSWQNVCKSRLSGRTNAIVPGSSFELVDPETGCEVVLVGCFHGSKSSALDVSTCMNVPWEETSTQVVVLELCASRFTDMRRDMDREEAEQEQPATPVPWIFRYGSMISKTIQNRGLSTGLAAALLGGVSGMQTALSGLEPGLEFRTAVEQVQKTQHGNKCDIVLADQNVDETLEKVGQLFSISLEMWKTFFEKGWDESFGPEARALARAVAGSPDVFSSGSATPTVAPLNLWSFCTRSPDAIRDMLRLLIPPAIMLQFIATGVDKGMEWMQTQQADAFDALAASSATEPSFEGMIAVLVVNWMIIAFGYLSVALPAARVILRERDDILTQGIREACRVAADNAARTNHTRGRVVAVLGLLHVNGIAERLQHPASHVSPKIEQR